MQFYDATGSEAEPERWTKFAASGGHPERAEERGLNAYDSFLLVLSADALRSDWVRKEVELAMRDPRYAEKGRIVPMLAKPCAWQTLHPEINRFQLVDFTADREEAIRRLLHFWQIDRYVFPQFQVGDVLIRRLSLSRRRRQDPLPSSR